MKILTTTQVGEHLGITADRVRQLARSGRFPNAYLHGTVWVIPEDDVKNFEPKPAGKPKQPRQTLRSYIAITAITFSSEESCGKNDDKR